MLMMLSLLLLLLLDILEAKGERDFSTYIYN
jgi:hypothetical protein